MKRRPKLTPLDPNRCPPGFYWVRIRGSQAVFRIMELADGQWWHMGWDIPQRDMTPYEVLTPVALPFGDPHAR
jgi:hypothetical protein